MYVLESGKLEALEHVRKAYGFPIESTVACGDSGNDILMLAGEYRFMGSSGQDGRE